TACDNINAKNAKSEINKKSSLNKYSDMENNIPRILIVAKRYINEKRNLEINDLIDYIKYYEDFEENKNNSDYCFTMGEIWAFPLMLRIGI
ncbi:Glycosyltransferase, partial [human gut metagenome]